MIFIRVLYKCDNFPGYFIMYCYCPYYVPSGMCLNLILYVH